MLSLRVALALVWAAGQLFGASGIKALRFGKLVDGRGGVTTNAVVLIESERITAVGSSVPSGAEVIDLTRYTAIPGLIDAHTHMTYYWDRKAPPSQAPPRMAAVTVVLSQENARKTLEAGVTTVRDLNASEYSDIAMRDLINMGAMTGPRMFVSGYGLMISRRPPRPGFAAPSGGLADGVEEVMRVTRQQIGAGADWVKIFGSTGSGEDVSGFQTFTFDEMRAAVEVAHNLGKRVAIHSYGPGGARDAVRAGADSLEHAVDLDDQTLAEMVRRKTFYVPTIDHNRYYAENGDQFGYSTGYAGRLNQFVQRNLETARRAFQAGVRLAMGSDAVYSMFGQNTRELEWLVKAGMSPAQALGTATTNGAALLGMENTLGAIAPGYYADIVAVEGDPLADIGVVVRNVRWVMKGGLVVVDKR